MPTRRLSFKSRRAGKQPRAAFWHWIPRLIIHKRLAYARLGFAHALAVAENKRHRFYRLVRKHNLPVDDVGPMPRLPEMPGDAWIYFKHDMGELKPVVKATQPAIQQTVYGAGA